MNRFPHVQHLSLPVRDIEGETAFYRDFMGFPVDAASPDFVEIRAGGTLLALAKSDGAVSHPEGLHFGFREGSRAAVDDWGRKARERGLRIDFGPAVAEWGGYVVYFRDPEGYQLEIWTD